MKCLGLMSGTSVDGVDCAIVDIRGKGHHLRIRVLGTDTVPFRPQFRSKILQAMSQGTVSDICHLNAAVGEVFARAALKVMKKFGVTPKDIALIGSHGQTLYHQPKSIRETGIGGIRSTLQIGESSVIADRTGITTIANFRARDMAAGGQGAPLAPYLHFVTFQSRTRTRLVLNLGGIANLTYLPANGNLKQVKAFDTGPCNMVLDGLTIWGTKGRRSFDRGGRLALKGKIHSPLLRMFLAHPYFRKPSPKTTGREEFGELYVSHLIKAARKWKVPFEDMLATCCLGISLTISKGAKRFPCDCDDVVVGGGGVENVVLMGHLQTFFGIEKVKKMEELGWGSHSYEAIAFAVLAHQTWKGVGANVPGVTGARGPVVLGTIAPGENFRKSL
jgi:anhydro-N-acetylmuramic acid kinase